MNKNLRNPELVSVSIDYFEKYIEQGYDKLEKASLYLTFLYARLNNKSKEYEYEELTGKINKFKGNNFKINARNLYKTTEPEEKMKLEETYNQENDVTKHIEELIKSNNVRQIDEYLRELDETTVSFAKCEAIRLLYIYGHKKLADYYLKNIKKEVTNEEDKKRINEIQKCKKLYLNYYK